MSFIIKRYIYIFFLIILYFAVIFFDFRDRYLNNNFQENEVITIKVSNKENFDFDRFVALFDSALLNDLDIYIDKKDEYLFENAFKLYSNKKLQRKVSLLKKPSLEYLIATLSKNLNSNYYKKEINGFFETVKAVEILSKNIAQYFNYKELDNHIANKILYGLISDKEDYYKQNIQIKIVPSNSFESYFSKKRYFRLIFQVIENSLFTEETSITLNNKYIYDDFISYKRKENSKFKIFYEPIVIAYSEKINYLEKSNKLFNESNLKSIHKLENTSILNYITNSTLSGLKYKTIKKMMYNYNKLDNDNNPDYSINKDLLSLESALYDFTNMYSMNLEENLINSEISTSINKSLIYIKSILLSLKSNNNLYKQAFLRDRYYNEVVNYFKLNVNTEKITLNNLNKDIVKLYSSYNTKYYLTKFNKNTKDGILNEKDYRLIESCFKDTDVSSYNNIYHYIKLIIWLSFISFFVIRIKKFK